MPSEEGTAPTCGVRVDLDRTRHLRYSLRTVREMCADFEVGALEELELGVNTLGKFLWYGLRGEDEGLTIEAVEEMVDLQNIVPLQRKVAEAMGGSEPDGEEGDENAADEGADPPTIGVVDTPRDAQSA